jgi:hypothetical protein
LLTRANLSGTNTETTQSLVIRINMHGKKRNPYLGRWRIVEMETWDQEYVDLVTEGNFTFGKDGMGNFEFGAIKADTDYTIEEIGNTERAEFSFEGYDEYDPVSGRGWVIIENDTLTGKIFFHAGDDSEFKAKRIK